MIRALLALLSLAALVDARAPIRYRQRPADLHTLTTFQTNSTILTGTGGTSASDNVNIWKGSQSNRLTVGDLSRVLFTATLPTQANICSDSFMQVTFKLAGKNSVLNLNQLLLRPATDPSNTINHEFGSFRIRDTLLTYWGGWSQCNVSIKKFAESGSFDCAHVNSVIVGFQAQSGTQDTIVMGEIATFPRRAPIATLIFNEDDQWDSWRIYGAPKLDSLGWRHTLFLNAGRLGVVNFMQEYQVDSMYRRGLMDVGSHLWTHDSTTDLTPDSLLGSIRRNRDFIRAHGWKGYSMFAYPFGKKSRAVDSIIRASGLVDFARLTKGDGTGEAQQFNDNYNIPLITSLGTNSDTTVVNAIIDTIVTHGTTGIILIHQIGPVGCTEDGNTWCKDHWLSIVNHAKTKVDAGLLRVMSLGDYLEQYGGGYGPAQRAGIGR